MTKISEREWTFRGTDYHLRAYVDANGRAAPVFLVQEAKDNRGRPVADVRGDLAEHLSTCLDTRPEQVTWLERSRNGTLVQYDIKPYRRELSTDESERAHPSGGAIEAGRPRYNFIARELSREECVRLEARLKDRLHAPRSQVDLRNERGSGSQGGRPAPDRSPEPER